MNKKKIVIFQYLDVLACMCVLFGHVITYNTDAVNFLKEIGNHLTYIPYNVVENLVLIKYINLGQFGVALFFLLSGFLIMRSREFSSTKDFLAKRILRIFPISTISILLCFIATEVMNLAFFNIPFKFDLIIFNKIITNCLLINDLFCLPSIIPVYWFLLVLVKFYLLMVFAKNFKQKEFLITTLCLLTIVFSYTSLGSVLETKGNITLFIVLRALAFSAHHIIYALIGSSLYLLFKNYVFVDEKFKFNKDIIYPIAIYLLFILSFTTYHYSPTPFDNGMPKNYTIALILFIISLIFSHKVTFKVKGLDFLNSIIFPVYTLHWTIGAFYVFLLAQLRLMKENLFIMYSIVFVSIILTAYVVEKITNYCIGILRKSK